MNTLEASSETVEPTQGADTRPAFGRRAWSPTAIAWICVLFSMLPAGLMYAFNFERLGRPEKKKRTLFFVLSSAIIYYLMVVRFLLVELDAQAPALSVRTWFHFINIAIAWQFYLKQQGLFVRHIQQGGRKAPLFTPIVLSVLWMLMITVGYESFLLNRDISEFNRGVGLIDMGKYQEAETILKNHKAQYPEDTNAAYNLAIVYARTKRFPLAKQELKDVLSHEPDNQEANELLQQIETR